MPEPPQSPPADAAPAAAAPAPAASATPAAHDAAATPVAHDAAGGVDVIGVGEPGTVGVYGAPRPAVPQRLPVMPRHRGCGSGAGPGLAAAQGGFRRLPDWLKV